MNDREGHEAVFCDGVSCRVWYHRWCAGVTNKRYESLAGSEAPFLCPVCVMGQQSCVIAALQEAVKSLTIQVAELQLQHACSEVQLSQHARSEEQPSTMPPQKWNLMVRNGKGGCHRDSGYGHSDCGGGQGGGHVGGGHGGGGHGGGGHGGSGHGGGGRGGCHRDGHGDSGLGSRLMRSYGVNNGGQSGCDEVDDISGRVSLSYGGRGRVDGVTRSRPSQRRKIPVVNARKVWGTLKSSTCSTVATVFKKLISQSLAVIALQSKESILPILMVLYRDDGTWRGVGSSRVGKSMGSYCNTNKLEVGASFQV